MSSPRSRTVETVDGPEVVHLARARASSREYRDGDVVGGKYRLVRLLGEGGMGSVWLATNLTLEADVALKLIRRGMATEETASRLLLEARAAARLEHGSIVRVFDFGATEAGDPFIVMELLRGESLAEVLERTGRLPAGDAVRIVLPLAGALAAAHDKGIVHRDLKPENVFLSTSDGGVIVPKIVDFGIAVLDREPGARRTVQGMVMGSPDYMSPEQAQGDPIDGRSDVWSLAVVLYESISGERPFCGEGSEAQMRSVLRDPPRRLDRALCDPRLWTILQRAFAKNPNERWQTMRGFGVALAQWAVSQKIGTDIAAGELSALWLGQGTGVASTALPLEESGLVLVPPAVRAARRHDRELARHDTPQGDRAGRPRRPRSRPWRSALGAVAVILVALGALAGGVVLHDALAPRLQALEGIHGWEPAPTAATPTPTAAAPAHPADPASSSKLDTARATTSAAPGPGPGTAPATGAPPSKKRPH